MGEEYSRIEDALQALKEGRVIIVVDDEDRENEGDFIAAAEKVTPEIIEFMITHGRGLLVHADHARGGRAAPARPDGRSQHGAAPDAVHRPRGPRLVPHRHQRPGAGADGPRRSSTRRRSRPTSSGPGICSRWWPRRAGVLRRAGHTEATVDLARLAGLVPAGVICEITDGIRMAGREQLHAIAREHGLPIVSIEALIKYRRLREKLVHRAAEADLPTRYGHGRIIGYRVQHEPGNEPIAFVMGDLRTVGGAPGPAALLVLHGRPARLAAVRLRRPAPHGAGDDRRRGGGGPDLPAPGRAGDRPDREDPRVQPPGQGARHRPGQPRPGLPGRHCATTASACRSSRTWV